ncbi:MAG: epimerase [Planctomycetota bacterium]|nr:MAG: epimerase [Planctomycetota bacterium]
MRKPASLITGASGEIGHGLIRELASRSEREVLALDLKPLGEELEDLCAATFTGDILDPSVLQRIVSKYEIQEIYHLAALLSTRAEYAPAQAQRVNVNGTMNLFELAQAEGTKTGTPVRFLFPSSIAVYGLPDRATKAAVGRIKEDDYLVPTTMYGCNKLSCEHLGRYFSFHFNQLAKERPICGVDFRGLRFPGLISAETLPTGGTSDYAPEMVHAAAKDEPYACFVDEDAVIPFMAMPDAIRTMTMLAAVDSDKLSRRSYNVGSFSLTGSEIKEHVLKHFPKAQISFVRDEPRARIVDSWPADVNDDAARADWAWKPEYGAEQMFADYLVPGVRRHYGLD